MLIRVLTAPVPGHRRNSARMAEPVTFGVPLPEGLIKNPENWTLGGRMAQARVLDRWSDGSARWVLVDGQIDLPSDGLGAVELETDGAVTTGAVALTVTAGNNSVVVETGVARFELRTGSEFPFSSVTRGQFNLIDPARIRLVATDRDGTQHEALVSAVSVESQGPVRAVVRLDGTLALDGARKLLLTVRASFFSGLSTVRLRVTLTNPDPAVHEGGFWDLGDPGSVLFKDVSVHLPFAPVSGAAEVRCSPELAAPLESMVAPLELYQDSSGGERWQSSNHKNRERRVPVTFRGYRVRSGGPERMSLRASPIVTIRRGTAELGASIPHFWQNFPKAIEADDTGITLRLFPQQFADLHELQGGEQKTHDCWLTFGGDAVSDIPLDWCRSPTRVCVDPAWAMSTGAVPFLAPLSVDHAALVNAAIEGPDRFEQKREVIDEYGWRHFGEIYGDHESVRQKDPPIVSHYNNQYDPVAGFILQYLRTADPRWWTMADELATHVADIDIYHTDGDKSAYNRGLFWHTYHYGDADIATHRTYPVAGKGHIHGGGPSSDQNYTSGLMLHYFLTGDEMSRQTVIDLGRFVLGMDDGTRTVFRWLDRGDTGRAIQSAIGYFGPGRGPANSLNALIDAHRLSGDAAFLRKAEQLVRRVVHPSQDIAALRLDVPEQRWFYTMFLQSLGKYLHYRVERHLVDDEYAYAQGSLLHFADWMAANEHPYFDKPERLEFKTETWPAQDIRKSDVFAYAALHSTGERRSRFVERARFFSNYSLQTLLQAPTRALARPVVVLLGSGFLNTWVEVYSAAQEPVRSHAEPIPPFRPFVPQRARAEKKLKLLGMASAGLVALIALLAVIL